MATDPASPSSPPSDPFVLMQMPMGNHHGLIEGDPWVGSDSPPRLVRQSRAPEAIRRGGRLVPNEELTRSQRIELILRQSDSDRLSARQIGAICNCSHAYVIMVGKRLGLWPRPPVPSETRKLQDQLRIALSQVNPYHGGK